MNLRNRAQIEPISPSVCAARLLIGADMMLIGDTAMKTTALAIIALSVLIGVATPAGADPFNAKDFFAYLERWSGGND